MGFSITESIPVLTVFIQGLLSFFSPCVLPIIPIYISYLAGGTAQKDEDGKVIYPRKKVLLNTVFFVLGVGFTFFVLGMGITAVGKFFSSNRMLFARISGIIMIAFGLYQLGVFGKIIGVERERRLPFKLDRLAVGPLSAFVLGFTFSFAWTPCVGPILGSVLLMAGSAETAVTGFWLIGVYTLGFILPFILLGLFTGSVLNFLRSHGNVVKYTVKIGAALLIFMGVMTLTGMMNNITGYLSGFGTASDTSQTTEQTSPQPEETQEQQNAGKTDDDLPEAIDFELTDQNGKVHKLSDYKGKTVFLNFWATWCPPCQAEMPHIQELYEEYGINEGDLVILGVAAPNIGREGTASKITSFLKDKGYTFPTVMDTGGDISSQYGIRAYPTTFMINKEGKVFGYIESSLTKSMMRSIIEQTMSGKR